MRRRARHPKEARLMIRRRRRGTREIPFSFDSFLDIVANVAGIIIRLILVVWIGARSYHGMQEAPPPAEPEPAAIAEETDPSDTGDPLEGELTQERKQLAAAEKALREQLNQL